MPETAGRVADAFERLVREHEERWLSPLAVRSPLLVLSVISVPSGLSAILAIGNWLICVYRRGNPRIVFVLAVVLGFSRTDVFSALQRSKLFTGCEDVIRPI